MRSMSLFSWIPRSPVLPARSAQYPAACLWRAAAFLWRSASDAMRIQRMTDDGDNAVSIEMCQRRQQRCIERMVLHGEDEIAF